ncbi:Scr1 family TA system antitoxin-like transcriptional regulator [Streptomyces sp. NPDC005336]|uniref:Scr1 family TA system antitoxin-like transcriptional regulator n=1 Tax=Streptomyces sp. NPDC005336 TaxID=3157035 RepID=UPI0033AEEBF4
MLRRVGPDEVMLGQMLYLLETADLPHVTIRFVLLDRLIAGNEASMAGGMAHLQFGRGGLPDLVYVEGYGKADYYNKPARSAEERAKPWPTKDNEFERHLQLLLRIQGEACASPAASRRLLEAAVKRYS